MKTNPTNKKQFAYQILRERILDGTYSPGYRIIIDRVAKELSLSAIPVREAIRHLEADGLIDFEPNVGAVVTPIDENKYLETLSTLAVIEGYATGLSVKGFPDERIPDLTAMNEKMSEAIEQFDFIRFGDLNRQFHALTYEFCENRYLVETIEQTRKRIDSIRRTGSAFMPIRPRESITEHETLIWMFREKRPSEEVEKYARKHKMNTVESFQKRREEDEARNPLR